MSALQAVCKFIVAVSFLLSASFCFAQSKTVGDLLNKIERDSERVKLKKRRSNLPKYQKAKRAQQKTVNLRAVKPPSNNRPLYPEGTDEAALIAQTDQAIAQLFKLTQRYKKSSQRGELWLRLAEQYVEKAKLIEYKLTTKYDKDMQRFLDKKTKRRPRLNLSSAQEYNKKAIQLYEWFIRDFPKDKKVPQALYFLGFNNFEIGNLKKGENYYIQLTKRYPKNEFVTESNYALAEFYFENEKWKPALNYYLKVVRKKQSRLNSLATYKSSWCYYKLNNTKRGIKFLERVIVDGRRSKGQGEAGGSRIRLAKEAIKDLVLFYAEVGDPKQAYAYFSDIIGPKSAKKYVGQLGNYYLDTGNTRGARFIYKKWIEENPTSPESFEYQSKIVTMFQTSKDQKSFREELYLWVNRYGPRGPWQRANSKNAKLISQSNEKMEFTLRNHVLQLHQSAQNSKIQSSQKRALDGYKLYFSTFNNSGNNSKKYAEMKFFHGELLFDIGSFDKAAAEYLWVIKNDPKGEYTEKSILNRLLALEKQLPDAKGIKEIVAGRKDSVKFPKNIVMFEQAALAYFQSKPKGDNIPAIKYRVGALHYYFNHYDEALKYFNEIVEKYPKTQYASYSANLILDIYNLKKDYIGLQAAASNILKVPGLAKSKVGQQIQDIKVQTDFKLAKNLEDAKKYKESADQYKAFAQKNKQSPLAVTAVFNAGINYERIGLLSLALPMYEAVAASRASKDKSLVYKSSKFLPPLYEKLGQYLKAAKSFESFAKKNPKDKLSVEYYYNAAIIFDALKQYTSAERNLNIYYNNKKGSDKFEALFLLAKIYERRRSYDRALGYYDQYMNSGTVNAAGVVEAAFSISKIHRKRRKKKFADEWHEKTVATQRSLARKGKVVGTAYAAEAKFHLVDDTYYDLIKIKIPRSPAAQGKAVQKKLGLLNKLKEDLKDVIAYDDGYQIVAALNLQAQALNHMYTSLLNAPKPKGLNATELKQYTEGVRKIATPFRDQARDTVNLAVKRAYELSAYSPSLEQALSLQERLMDKKSDSKNFVIKQVSAIDWMGSPWKSEPEAAVLKVVAEKLSKNPKDIKILNALGAYYLHTNRPRLARIILNRALASHPNEPSLYNNLALVYRAEDDKRTELENLIKSQKFGRYNLGALNLSAIYLKHKDYRPAQGPLKRAYRAVRSDLKKPDSAAIANNYAVALASTDSAKSAEDIFEAVLKSGSRDAEVHLNYAILLLKDLNKKIDGQKILSKIQFMTEDRAILKRAEELEDAIQ